MIDDPISIMQEAMTAIAVGVIGALGKVAVAADDRPMLRTATVIRIFGDTAAGLGCWITLHAMGFDSWAAVAAAFAGGALGFAALHDLLLRMVKRQAGGRR